MALRSMLVLGLLAVSCPKPIPPKKCGDVFCPPGTVCRLVWSGQNEDSPRLECVPDFKPSPSPSPAPSPVPSPSPGPSPVGCPVQCVYPQWIGIAFLSRVPVNTQGGIYLGWRYNVSGTPHTRVEACQDRPGSTEQRKDCQDPLGPDFYMTLPGKWENEPIDKASQNPWNAHHKPKSDETGLTTMCVVPRGAAPNDPRGRCLVIDVQK